jgi:outer membrane protein OmpA-like peptidoglycan-associated protein
MSTVMTVLICSTLLAGNINHRPFSLELSGGGLQPALNDSAQVWAMRPFVGGALQYMITPQTGLLVAGMYANVYNDTTSTSLLQSDRSNANQRWLIRSVSVGPKFYLQQRGGTAAYLLTTVDLLRWRVVHFPSGVDVEVEDASGKRVDFAATELGATIGLGIERLIFGRIGLCAGFNFTYLTGIGADFADWADNARSRALMRLSASLTFNFGFGAEKSAMEMTERSGHESNVSERKVYVGHLDEETGDTVFVDQAKGESGEIVPIEKKRDAATVDDDMDGVVNTLDRCPDTPLGALVDSTGCPHDSDGDGIYDGLDLCPDTPKEARSTVDEDGCAVDTDFDGVPDYRDKCPNTVPALRVDSAGCPVDHDNDGVDDEFDICPDTPAGIPVDARGCPEFHKVFAKRVISSLFRPGGTKLAPEGHAVLDTIVNLMQEFPNVTAVVKGYTDDIGPSEANTALSKKRARAVMIYLVKQGVAESRLQALGLGETNFIAPNRTKAGREQNRRVEIEFSYLEE